MLLHGDPRHYADVMHGQHDVVDNRMPLPLCGHPMLLRLVRLTRCVRTACSCHVSSCAEYTACAIGIQHCVQIDAYPPDRCVHVEKESTFVMAFMRTPVTHGSSDTGPHRSSCCCDGQSLNVVAPVLVLRFGRDLFYLPLPSVAGPRQSHWLGGRSFL